MRGLLFVLIVAAIAGGIFWSANHELQLRQSRDQYVASLKKQDYTITTVEGWRREQIAQALQADGICSASDFMAASAGKEGYLFPDTYRFYKDTSAGDVVQEMTEDFATRTDTLKPTADQVILASIVEREALHDADRPIIAGIYQHRLDIGMKLQSDPTVQYGKDTLAQATGLLTAYWQPITAADYTDVQSPFNTYLISGLPPSPISDPGLKSLEAAVNPAPTDDLYFLYNNGQLETSTTLQEHIDQE